MHISHSTPAGGIRSLSPSRGVKSPVVPVALKRFYCRAKRAKSGVPTFSTISANNSNCKKRFSTQACTQSNPHSPGRGSVPAARMRKLWATRTSPVIRHHTHTGGAASPLPASVLSQPETAQNAKINLSSNDFSHSPYPIIPQSNSLYFRVSPRNSCRFPTVRPTLPQSLRDIPFRGKIRQKL